jgi:6,7-dimethyl-8-ribityllumazine synthase
MPRLLQGKLTAEGGRFAVVVSRFNEFITSKLMSGAVETLVRQGCDPDRITCAQVPGAFELPLVAKKLAETRSYDAVICLGCVLRGETPHFEYIAAEAAKGIAQVALDSGVPVTFGVITADTLEQAIERAGGNVGNKGTEAALSAIELAHLLKQLPSECPARP